MRNCQFKFSIRPGGCNQPHIPRCFAVVEIWSHHIATVPSVRNAGGRGSKALQVEPPVPDCFWSVP